MVVRLEFLNDSHGVKATVSGEVTGEALVQAVRQVNAFAASTGSIFYTFFDCERLRAISVTVGDLAAAAMCAIESAKLRKNDRVVAIYASDEYSYRLARIYMTFIEQTGWEAWAFRDRAEAIEWLRSRAATKHGLEIDIAT